MFTSQRCAWVPELFLFSSRIIVNDVPLSWQKKNMSSGSSTDHLFYSVWMNAWPLWIYCENTLRFSFVFKCECMRSNSCFCSRSVFFVFIYFCIGSVWKTQWTWLISTKCVKGWVVFEFVCGTFSSRSASFFFSFVLIFITKWARLLDGIHWMPLNDILLHTLLLILGRSMLYEYERPQRGKYIYTFRFSASSLLLIWIVNCILYHLWF